MTAKVITVFNQKGGCGKTTVSVQLAGTLGRRRARVLLIDLDPQGSATHWVRQAKDDAPFPANVVGLAAMRDKVHREIKAHLEDYDFIIADCPPAAESPVASSALLVSDLGIMPVVPTPLDVWATDDKARALIANVSELNTTLKVVLLPNRVHATTSLAKSTVELIREDDVLPVMKTQLGSRTVYCECPLYGATVHSVPSAHQAIEEVDRLTDEVLSLLSMETRFKENSVHA